MFDGDLDQLERRRADLIRKLDGFEAGETDMALSDAQRQSAARYMRRAISEFNTLVAIAKKKLRLRGDDIHLF
jgi:hypothetical protein